MGPPGLSGSLYHGLFLGILPAYKPLQTVTFFSLVGGDGHGGGGWAYLLVKIRPISPVRAYWQTTGKVYRVSNRRSNTKSKTYILPNPRNIIASKNLNFHMTLNHSHE